MGQVMLIASVVSTVAQASSQIQQAKQQAQQIAFQAAQQSANLQLQANSQIQESNRLTLEQQQLDAARRDELIASAQEETERRRELRETLSTIDSIRAARGMTISPTSKAITRDIRKSASADIRTNKLNRMVRADSLRMQSQYAGSLAAYSKDTAKFYNDQAGMVRSSAKSSMKSTLRAGYMGAGMSLLSGAAGFATSGAGAKLYGGPTSTTLSSGESINWGSNRYGIKY